MTRFTSRPPHGAPGGVPGMHTLEHATCLICKRPVSFQAPPIIIGASADQRDSDFCGNAAAAFLSHLKTAHPQEANIIDIMAVMMQTFAIYQHFEFNQAPLVRADEVLAARMLDYIHNEPEPSQPPVADLATPPAPRPPK